MVQQGIVLTSKDNQQNFIQKCLGLCFGESKPKQGPGQGQGQVEKSRQQIKTQARNIISNVLNQASLFIENTSDPESFYKFVTEFDETSESKIKQLISRMQTTLQQGGQSKQTQTQTLKSSVEKLKKHIDNLKGYYELFKQRSYLRRDTKLKTIISAKKTELLDENNYLRINFNLAQNLTITEFLTKITEILKSDSIKDVDKLSQIKTHLIGYLSTKLASEQIDKINPILEKETLDDKDKKELEKILSSYFKILNVPSSVSNNIISLLIKKKEGKWVYRFILVLALAMIIGGFSYFYFNTGNFTFNLEGSLKTQQLSSKWEALKKKVEEVYTSFKNSLDLLITYLSNTEMKDLYSDTKDLLYKNLKIIPLLGPRIKTLIDEQFKSKEGQGKGEQKKDVTVDDASSVATSGV